MTSSGIYSDIRYLYNFSFRPSDSLWSGGFSDQNSAPLHVFNSRVRVTLTTPPPQYHQGSKNPVVVGLTKKKDIQFSAALVEVVIIKERVCV